MRHIGFKPAARDEDIQIPIWLINDAELLILAKILNKADVYISDFYTPDRSRVRHMRNQIGDYLTSKQVPHSVKIEDNGMFLRKAVLNKEYTKDKQEIQLDSNGPAHLHSAGYYSKDCPGCLEEGLFKEDE